MDANTMTAFWSFVPIAMVLLGAAIGLITAYLCLKWKKSVKDNHDHTADDGHVAIQIDSAQSTPPFEMDSSEDSVWTVPSCHTTTELIAQDRSYFL